MENNRVVLVGIVGGSGCGKEKVRQALARVLRNANFMVNEFTMDMYYLRASKRNLRKGKWNFDIPKAVDFRLFKSHLEQIKKGKKLRMPDYCMEKSDRIGTVEYCSTQINLVDGILLFHRASIRNLLDFRIYVDAPDDIRLRRRIIRDVKERKRTKKSVIKGWNNFVLPAHRKYVEPSRCFAHGEVENRVHLQKTMPFEESEAAKSKMDLFKRAIIKIVKSSSKSNEA